MCGFCLFAQNSVTGVCLSESDHSPFIGCNVIVYDEAGSILGFTTSGADGKWEVSLKDFSENRIKVVATGFNIQKTEIVVQRPFERIELFVKEAELSIRESIISIEPIKQRGDTITYNVSSFKSETDRTIAEVLERMPGMEVDESGGIKYQGKAINKFYVEGLDMLGSSYGIASNTIRAEDVMSVEVYERHQPIKSLKELIPSDNSAINLILKNGSKGTWSGSVEGGGGYRPILWNAGITGMFFGKGFQTLDLYKGNNEGERNSRMLKEQVRGIDQLGEIVKVSIPFSPSISEDRYLDFTEHSLSGNALVRINNDATFRSNVSYLSSNEVMQGSTQSEYYFADGEVLIFNESLARRHNSKKISFEGQLENNSERSYIRNNIRITGRWNDDSGTVVESESISRQNSHHKLATFANDLLASKRIGDKAIRFYSVTGYQSLPEYLDLGTSVQRASQGILTSNNRAHVTLTYYNWTFDPGISLKYDGHWLKSEMNREEGAIPDSLRNDRFGGRINVQLQNNISWRPAYWLRFGVGLPIGLISFVHDNRIRDERTREVHCYANPSIYNELSFNQKFGLTTRITYADAYEDDIQWYPGYIMNTYRTVKKTDTFGQKSKRYTLITGLRFTDVTKALFCNVDITLMREARDFIYCTEYSGIYLIDNTIDYQNVARSAQFSMGMSKGLNAIRGNIDLKFDYITGRTPYQRQGKILDSRSNISAVTVLITSNPFECFDIKYNAVARIGYNSLENHQLPSTSSVSQDLQLGVRFSNRVWWTTGVQDYYSSLSGSSHNILFIDSGLSYKNKRVEYSLTARNLTNAKVMETTYINTMNTHSQSISLRPLSVVFTIEVMI